MAHEADKSLGATDGTIVMSTGVIGQRLPIDKIISNVPAALRRPGILSRPLVDSGQGDLHY